MIVEKMGDLEPIIKHVLVQYNDLFDWVFANISNLDLDQKISPYQSNVEFDDQNNDTLEYCPELCHLEKFSSKSEMSCTESDNDSINENDECLEILSEINQIDNQMDEIKTDSAETEEQEEPQVLQKRPRGRPRNSNVKPKEKNLGQLWEFLVELLASHQTNPSLIRWVCRKQGLFKLIQNEKVAKIWGNRRHNPKMNYKKMSRTMRYYYKNKIMIPVFGRKLVYQFGPGVLKHI